MELQIVPCKEEYIADCVRISVTNYDFIHEKYAEILGRDLHDGALPAWREAKANAIENQQRRENAIVALIDGEVAGFASWNPMPNYGQITNNAVDGRFRGNGIAGRLYSRLLDDMRKKGYQYAAVVTGLDDGHTPARHAYQKAGFEKGLPEIDFYQKIDHMRVSSVSEWDDGVRIVPYTEQYADACRRIALTMWTPIFDMYETLLGTDLFSGVMSGWQTTIPNGVQTLLESGRGFVLLSGDKPAGFIGWRIEGKNGRIGYNAVSPEYRGRGYAGRMYSFVLHEMQKAGLDYARVHTGLDDAHAPARSAYRKVGFETGLPGVMYYRVL